MNRRDILKRLAAMVAAVPVVGRLARSEPKVISTASRVGKTIGGEWRQDDLRYMWVDDLTCPLCGKDWEVQRGDLLLFGIHPTHGGYDYQECAHGDKSAFLSQCKRSARNADQYDTKRAKEIRRFADYIKEWF